jgi:hypothetical protein
MRKLRDNYDFGSIEKFDAVVLGVAHKVFF